MNSPAAPGRPRSSPTVRSLLRLTLGIVLIVAPIVLFMNQVESKSTAFEQAPQCPAGAPDPHCIQSVNATVVRVYTRTTTRNAQVTQEDPLVDLDTHDGRSHTVELARMEDLAAIPEGVVTAELWRGRVSGLQVDGQTIEVIVPRAGMGLVWLAVLGPLVGLYLAGSGLAGFVRIARTRRADSHRPAARA